MDGSYTWQVCSQVLSLLDKETCSIWNTIQTQTPGDDASRWRETLGRVAKEYSLSSRFALMRILAARDGGFPVTRPFSPTQAAELTVQESLDCLNRLLEMAGRNPDNDPELCEYLITRAWYDEEGANEAAAALLPRELAESLPSGQGRLCQGEQEKIPHSSHPPGSHDAGTLPGIFSGGNGMVSSAGIRLRGRVPVQ